MTWNFQLFNWKSEVPPKRKTIQDSSFTWKGVHLYLKTSKRAWLKSPDFTSLTQERLMVMGTKLWVLGTKLWLMGSKSWVVVESSKSCLSKSVIKSMIWKQYIDYIFFLVGFQQIGYRQAHHTSRLTSPYNQIYSSYLKHWSTISRYCCIKRQTFFKINPFWI